MNNPVKRVRDCSSWMSITCCGLITSDRDGEFYVGVYPLFPYTCFQLVHSGVWNPAVVCGYDPQRYCSTCLLWCGHGSGGFNSPRTCRAYRD
jgi:hypothetical protein